MPRTDVGYHARRKRVFTGFLNLLKTAPCTDCRGSFPWFAMEFDHVRGTHRYKAKKLRYGAGVGVNSMYSNSWKVIVEEIQKCDVVCATCHKVRTYARRAA
jgi:hypothetical protein